MLNHKAVQLALRNQLLTLSIIPPLTARSWENKRFVPTVGVEYVAESFDPSTSKHDGLADIGYVEFTGLYVIDWYGLAGTGTDVADSADAVLALFPPKWSLLATDGTVVRMRSNPAPYRGGTRKIDGGWTVCSITIPWVCTKNATT